LRLETEDAICRFQRSLYIAAWNICKNKEDAEDAVQETYMQYHKKRLEYNDEEHIKAWLLRVVINKAKDMNKSFWNRHKTTWESDMASGDFASNQSREVYEAVMELPDTYSTVVLLYYFEDYSTAEIAQILHISETNARVRLSRAREMLKERLKEEWYDE
jgi:RNA polymerase sigma-70 factor (ECF subfamily)